MNGKTANLIAYILACVMFVILCMAYLEVASRSMETMTVMGEQ